MTRPAARAALALPLAGLLGTTLLAACGPGEPEAAPTYVDGTYTGRSEPDEQGAYGQVTLTIVGNDITGASYETIQADGSTKGPEYGTTDGEIANQEYYDRAQDAVAAGAVYAEQLVEVDDVDDVDVVAGATISHGQFVEAVTDALEQARG